MNTLFAETLKKLRIHKRFSQRDLAERMYVTRSTVTRWESGSRLPDAAMIYRLAGCLDTDVNTLLSAAAESNVALMRTDAPVLSQTPDAPLSHRPHVIMVDDKKLFLSGTLPVLEEAMPNASITGFTRPSEAIEFAKANRIALAFLDIEMGKISGLNLCHTLLSLNPCTNVVYLTAYIEYSFDAWSTGASGFLLKPITPEDVREQLKKLRYPFSGGDRFA